MKKTKSSKKYLAQKIPQLQPLKLEQLETVAGGAIAIIRKEG